MEERVDDQALVLVKQVLAQSRPRTVRQLVAGTLVKDSSVSEDRILTAIDALKDRDMVSLRMPLFESFHDFFLEVTWNTDFFVVLILAATSGLLYLLATGFPWRLLEIVPGALLVFYFPGHSFLKVVLTSRDLQPLEKLVLEIGTSVVLVLLIGLLLNFSGFGLLSAPALSLVVLFNILLALWASYHLYSTVLLR